MTLDVSLLDEELVAKNTKDAFTKADDGEVFVEASERRIVGLDDSRITTATRSSEAGFGLRVIKGDRVGYAHSDNLDEAALKRASDAVALATEAGQSVAAKAPNKTNHNLYGSHNPVELSSFADEVALLEAVDAYCREKDAQVVQVRANIALNHQRVEIHRPDGQVTRDDRPLVRVDVSVIVEKDGRRETGHFGYGGRDLPGNFLTRDRWQAAADEALRQAHVNLEAIPAPAGEMEVVLGAGWPGILLHEAVGHGLEGDFNRKKTSAFAGLMGQRVAAKGVTVIDDGTITGRRGSLNVDDEGSPSQKTTLIEDGILVGYMQDRMNARLMGMEATGNGRRESYAHQPMPRMTNTYMLGGKDKSEDIIASIGRGIYAVSFGGGQVDITSGKFVFSCTEAYLVENGTIKAPVKGATLIGNGPESLHTISMIADDMALDSGIGTCGKAGQGVPVGVGQPTIKLDRLTVGGTETA
ncbi:MAG TPA: metalloprotease TldD [Alphaproteobacteria bacterium]|nr:metalloprotease TldD [Paracoccaceae bacterium]HBQ23606.1 metalloprotease TldD [Alphaproteobacteria bacterium]HCJ61891.1 metalloprotease TldD [Alphaproteobacteria bacterium]|tara:strand:- start:572 stop:1981 length:1410 start_codon:yes stop_codon:yes gene_type:complete